MVLDDILCQSQKRPASGRGREDVVVDNAVAGRPEFQASRKLTVVIDLPYLLVLLLMADAFRDVHLKLSEIYIGDDWLDTAGSINFYVT